MQIESEEFIVREKIPEPPKIEVVKDKLDIDDGENAEEEKKEEEPPQEEEGDENKPKFKPELYEWSWYDGKPRNYIQVVRKFTKIEPGNEKECSGENVGEELFNFIRDNGHTGILQLFKINK
jgi:hypothetical protein